MQNRMEPKNFVAEIRKTYGGLPDATTAMQHLLDACDIINSDQKKIEALEAACESAKAGFDVLLEKYAKELPTLQCYSDDLKAALALEGGER